MLEAAKGAGVTVGVHAQEGSGQHKSAAAAITHEASGRARLAGKFISKAREKELRARAATEEISILEVAIYNEFGLGVPERSFLRAWFDEHRSENEDALRNAVKLYLRGQKTLVEVLDLLGLKFQGGVQKKIAQGIAPPNAPSTIKEKGSSTPLIDTGQLRQSVTFLVRGGSSKPPT